MDTINAIELSVYKLKNLFGLISDANYAKQKIEIEYVTGKRHQLLDHTMMNLGKNIATMQTGVNFNDIGVNNDGATGAAAAKPALLPNNNMSMNNMGNLLQHYLGLDSSGNKQQMEITIRDSSGAVQGVTAPNNVKVNLSSTMDYKNR